MPDRDWCQIWTCKNDVVVTKQTPRLGVSRYLGVLKTGTGNNCAIILTLHWDTPSDPCLGPHRFVLQRIASQMKYYASRNFLEWGLRHRWYFLGGFPSRETRNEQRGECECGVLGVGAWELMATSEPLVIMGWSWAEHTAHLATRQ